jgi:diguanylate cyclase (GGDEF)-like protein
MALRVWDPSEQQLEVLRRIAVIIAHDLDHAAMLQRIVDVLAYEFGWEFVAFVGIDHEQGEFVCEALHSDLEEEHVAGYRRKLGSGVVGECAVLGETIDIDDVATWPNYVDTLGVTKSELCVPVTHTGTVIAVLNAESPRVGAFRGQRLLFETIAAQLAGVLMAALEVKHLQEHNTKLEGANRRLEATSRTDSLTGVGNRRRFDQWLKEAAGASRRTRTPMSVLLIDIDMFKKYNDTHGHPAGDEVLKRVATVLSVVLQDTPFRLARYGGEEFAAAGFGVDATEAHALAERLRAGVFGVNIAHAGVRSGRLTVSIGVASAIPGDAGPEEVTAAADEALYRAKRGGRDRVVSSDLMG